MQPAKPNGPTCAAGGEEHAHLLVFIAVTPSYQYFILGEQMSLNGSHVCLFTVDQSLAATAQCPHIRTVQQLTPAS
jgi:hypothetical protein